MGSKILLSGSIRFWLREDKMLSNGICPLYIIYSIHGKRSYYNTTIKLFKEQWNEDSQTISGLPIKKAKDIYNLEIKDIPTKEDVRQANNNLAKFISEISDIEKRFELDKVTYTSKDVLGKLKTAINPNKHKKTKQGKGITDNEIDDTPVTDRDKRDFISIKGWAEYVPAFIAKFCKDNPNIKDLKLLKKPRTLQLYKNIARDLIAFEKAEKKKPLFTNIDRDFMVSFFQYVVRENGNNNITGSKKISTLKTLLKFATLESYGYQLEVNPSHKEFSVSRTDNRNEVVALSIEEFQAIRDIQLDDPLLRQARDIFVFACYTGNRISDLETLRKEHIKNGTIDKITYKTKQRNTIPLANTAKEILSRYDNDPTLLMSMHRNHVNKHIKEVARLAGINSPIEKVREYDKETRTKVQPKYERITNHVGRKSFATMLLALGESEANTMALTGHKSIKAFQRYVNISNKQKEASIKKLDSI